MCCQPALSIPLSPLDNRSLSLHGSTCNSKGRETAIIFSAKTPKNRFMMICRSTRSRCLAFSSFRERTKHTGGGNLAPDIRASNHRSIWKSESLWERSSLFILGREIGCRILKSAPAKITDLVGATKGEGWSLIYTDSTLGFRSGEQLSRRGRISGVCFQIHESVERNPWVF